MVDSCTFNSKTGNKIIRCTFLSYFFGRFFFPAQVERGFSLRGLVEKGVWS